MKDLTSIGMIIIFVGILVIILSSFANPKSTNTKWAIGGFFGFIPFGFGNDKGMLYVVVALMVLMLISYFLFYFLRLR